MRVVREGNKFHAIHTTGPTSNLLKLELGTSPSVEVATLGEGEAKVTADVVQREVEEAVSAFNAAEGTSHQVAKIEFVVTDSPEPGIYGYLTSAILREASKSA